VFDAGRMARAYVELPEGWGPSRLILVAWKRAGYDVSRLVGLGYPEDPDVLLLNGIRPD
jgi:hypothetical protein